MRASLASFSIKVHERKGERENARASRSEKRAAHAFGAIDSRDVRIDDSPLTARRDTPSLIARDAAARGARRDAAGKRAREIRCDGDTESGVNGLSLVNGDRTFSVNATNERIRASRAART